MYTASRIIIERRLLRQHGAVGMSGDQDMLPFSGPLAQAFFAFFLYLVILGGAGGIQKAQILKRAPEIPYQKAGQRPERGIEQTGLVAVGQVKRFLWKRFGAQHQSLQKGRALFAGDIVIAVEKIQPAPFLKSGKHTVDIVVDLGDIAQLPVFPQFFPVSQLDISETAPLIMFQRRVVEMLVFQKIVGGSTHAPVTVTYENIFGASV